jgi:hypothetical protein
MQTGSISLGYISFSPIPGRGIAKAFLIKGRIKYNGNGLCLAVRTEKKREFVFRQFMHAYIEQNNIRMELPDHCRATGQILMNTYCPTLGLQASFGIQKIPDIVINDEYFSLLSHRLYLARYYNYSG